jgi:ribonucleoside-triphosphate reductase (thioredoxin)
MANYFPTPYQEFIYKSRYSRWIDAENRREDWPETVARYFDFFEEKVGAEVLTKKLRQELETSVLNLEVMPSMRALMTAGPALERCNVAGYNCAYATVDHPRVFDETLYILMAGTGVGFSVERKYIDKLPTVNEHFEESNTTIVVDDSKAGWAKSLRELISLLYAGQKPKWDVSKLRPAGARLKTFGGRSSGPGPLVELFEFATTTFEKAAGRRLTALEAHDIMCKVGDVVVSGGVRRSALISLSNVTDEELRKAKSGGWWEYYGHRKLANNSSVYTRKPDSVLFLREWLALVESKSGERGIFNREAAQRQAARNGRRDSTYDFGTNPCSEIILRPFQFCNLTEIVVRSGDDRESLKRKARVAAILGTLQSTLTDFKYLRKVWSDNTKEERLLGVSLTGILDNTDMSNGGVFLSELRTVVNNANAKLAKELGIPQSTATTCVKPSGTVSQLVDSASGIHTRYSPYYYRTVRGSITDPVTRLLMDQGVYSEWDESKRDASHQLIKDTLVFYFPQKSPVGVKTRHDMSAIEHLELWKNYQENWCEHKPSITVSVKDHEWTTVAAWVYENFDIVSGVSFLPFSDHTYKQAPYIECTKEEYEEMLAKTPATLDWSKLADYEKEDHTKSSQTFACTAEACEIVDIS